MTRKIRNKHMTPEETMALWKEKVLVTLSEEEKAIVSYWEKLILDKQRTLRVEAYMKRLSYKKNLQRQKRNTGCLMMGLEIAKGL
uniref:Uncharacterized protein n=1 Tax=viral metagenome TaxID=1070528 RepID=A0A6H1Z750_9ZZZZ